MLGEEPHAEHDQDDRPKAMQAEVKNSVDQKEYAQADQNRRGGGNLGGLELLSGAEGLCQPEGIRSGLARLNRLGSANGVQDLVDPEKSKKDSQHHIGLPRQ